jgi:hypothetical protein
VGVLGLGQVVEYVESSAKTIVSCRRYRKEYDYLVLELT